MYDIAIIGLGPAGATLARLLDKKFKVIAIDKKSNEIENSFLKPCGGLLAPDAQKALSRFNLTLPKDLLVDPQIFTVKTIDLKQKLLQHYQRFYINLDRHKFDMWLISLIPGHVEIADNAVCIDIKKLNEAYEIKYIQQHQLTLNKTGRTIKAKYIIGADGSNSIVMRKLFPKRKINQYIAIQQWLLLPPNFLKKKTEIGATPFYSCIFDESITDSYCWSISKDGYFIFGGAFPKKTAKRKFELLIEKLELSNIKPVKTEACLVSMPRRACDFFTGKEKAFFIGEAAGFISPSSLEGISYALNSSYELACILNANIDNDSKSKIVNNKYKIKCRPIIFKLLFKKYIKSPFMYNPFLRKLVMKSGIKRLDVVIEKMDCL